MTKQILSAILGHARGLSPHIPLFLFIIAIAMASFAYGGLVGRYKLFPHAIVSSGVKTFRTLLDASAAQDIGNFVRFAATSPENAAANRMKFLKGGSLGSSVLWAGGRFQFLDYCPDWGCIAVEYTAEGDLAHAYPYRPAELEQAWTAGASDEFPFEFSPAFSFARDVSPNWVHRYPNGDLLVIFKTLNTFPYPGGVARVDREGSPVWFRRDYSHHWAQIDDYGNAMLPALLLRYEPVSLDFGGDVVTLECRPPLKPCDSVINFIDEHGHIFKSLNIMESLLDSPFRLALQYATNPHDGRQKTCLVIHLNFVHRLGDDAGGSWGMAPGDMVASLRNLSAFAILDSESGRVKRLVRGSFFHQHSVQHFQGSRFLMFDNMGGDGVHGPSRILMIDLAGGEETTIFPNDSTPEYLKDLFSHTAGHIDVLPDRRRAIVAFTAEGMAVEISLPDGEALNVFTSLNDVSDLHQFPTERETKAAMFKLYGIEYISGAKGDDESS